MSNLLFGAVIRAQNGRFLARNAILPTVLGSGRMMAWEREIGCVSGLEVLRARWYQLQGCATHAQQVKCYNYIEKGG